jgi:hypothetical protein
MSTEIHDGSKDGSKDGKSISIPHVVAPVHVTKKNMDDVDALLVPVFTLALLNVVSIVLCIDSDVPISNAGALFLQMNAKTQGLWILKRLASVYFYKPDLGFGWGTGTLISQLTAKNKVAPVVGYDIIRHVCNKEKCINLGEGDVLTHLRQQSSTPNPYIQENNINDIGNSLHSWSLLKKYDTAAKFLGERAYALAQFYKLDPRRPDVQDNNGELQSRMP